MAEDDLITDDTSVDDKTTDDILSDDKTTDDKTVDTGNEDDADKAPAGDLLSDDEGAKPEGVPDEYTFEAPEGVTLEDAKLDDFKGAAKAAGLSQAQFSAMVQYDVERTQAAENAAVDAWGTRVAGWKTATASDKEVGGAHQAAAVTSSKAAIKQFGDAEFSALLKSPSKDNPQGLAVGNHPAMVRFLNRVGKVLADPTLITDVAATGGRTEQDMLNDYYPSMKQ